MSDYTIDRATGCWIWQRSTSLNGYGQLFHDSARKFAPKYSEAP